MARRLHEGRILRIGYFIAIDEELIEIDLPLRLLIEPALIRPSNEGPSRDDDQFFRQGLFGRRL